MTRSLFELVETHAGKTTDKWSLYVHEYDRLFEPYRASSLCLLEIGVQNGGSLDIWSEYFQQARLLVGCDIDEGCRGLRYADTRVQVVVGDASTAATRDQILSLSPRYDLIIDDGSHTSSDIVKSFALYFGALAEGGLYVVEDLHCSYWSDFQGGLYDAFASIHFFKALCDIVNHQSWGLSLSRQDLLKGFSDRYGAEFSEDLLAQVHSVEFLNSVCVIRKAAAEHNTLGVRVVRGRDALVNDGPLQVDGHVLGVPPQSLTAPAAPPPVFFDEAYYLTAYPDVAAAAVNALEHYLANGKAEGRYPTAEMAVLAAVEQAKASGDRQTAGVLAAVDRIEARQQRLAAQLVSLSSQSAALSDALNAQGSALAASVEACRQQMDLGQLGQSARLEALSQACVEQEARDRQWQDTLKVDLTAFNEFTQATLTAVRNEHSTQINAMAAAQETQHKAQLEALAEQNAREEQWRHMLEESLATFNEANQMKLEAAQREHAAQLTAMAVVQSEQDEQARRNDDRLQLEFVVLKEELVRMNVAYLATKQSFDTQVAALTVELEMDKANLAWRTANPFKSLWRDLVSRKQAGSDA